MRFIAESVPTWVSGTGGRVGRCIYLARGKFWSDSGVNFRNSLNIIINGARYDIFIETFALS